MRASLELNSHVLLELLWNRGYFAFMVAFFKSSVSSMIQPQSIFSLDHTTFSSLPWHLPDSVSARTWILYICMNHRIIQNTVHPKSIQFTHRKCLKVFNFMDFFVFLVLHPLQVTIFKEGKTLKPNQCNRQREHASVSKWKCWQKYLWTAIQWKKSLVKKKNSVNGLKALSHWTQ